MGMHKVEASHKSYQTQYMHRIVYRAASREAMDAYAGFLKPTSQYRILSVKKSHFHFMTAVAHHRRYLCYQGLGSADFHRRDYLQYLHVRLSIRCTYRSDVSPELWFRDYL